MWCFGEKKSAAQQRYLKRGMAVMGAYFVLLTAATLIAAHFHPRGVPLCLVALLPSLPILSLMLVIARYLREERDEYQRDLVIRCMLWGIAAMLTLELFTDFMRSFGWTGTLPIFTGFYAFCLAMLVAKFTYKYRDRVGVDDE